MSLEQQRSKDFFAARANWWLTIVGVILANVGAKLFPQYVSHLCGNAELSTAIALGVFNVASAFKAWLDHKAVRAAKNALIWIGALFVVGCSTVQQQLDPSVFYKRDIGIEINGQHYEGVTVVPFAKSYELTLYPKGDIDLLLLKTCHREYTAEKLSPGWFSKNKFRYTYTPVPGIEDSRTCPVRVDVYESGKGRHSWALIEQENPAYTVQAKLTCNGTVSHVNGVGVCQARRDTVQKIEFAEPVRFAPVEPQSCHGAKKTGSGYEINASLGECLYHYDTRDGKLGRLTIIAYDGILVREPQ